MESGELAPPREAGFTRFPLGTTSFTPSLVADPGGPTGT
jgi:hypothetical protein